MRPLSIDFLSEGLKGPVRKMPRWSGVGRWYREVLRVEVRPEWEDLLEWLEGWLWPLRVFGASPLHFPSGRFPLHRLLHSAFICGLLLCVTFGFLFQYNVAYINYGSLLSRVVQSLTVITWCASFVFRRQAWSTLVAEFSSVATRLQRLGHMPRYTRPPLAVHLLLSLMAFICYATQFYDYKLYLFKVVQVPIFISQFFNILYNSCLLAIFFGIITIMHVISDLLKPTLVLLRKSAVNPSSEHIVDIALLHDNVCYLCKKINNFFSLHFMLYTFVNFMQILFSVFAIFYMADTLPYLVRCTQWLSVGFIKTFFLSKLTSTLANWGNEFNSELFKMMINDETGELLNNKKLRLHISMKRKICFTACGFFNMDYTLVFSTITAAATYLVILIQFSDPIPTSAGGSGNGSIAISKEMFAVLLPTNKSENSILSSSTSKP